MFKAQNVNDYVLFWDVNFFLILKFVLGSYYTFSLNSNCRLGNTEHKSKSSSRNRERMQTQAREARIT